jgi:hypothetical protein
VIKALRDSNLSWSAYGQIIGDVAEMYVLDFFFFWMNKNFIKSKQTNQQEHQIQALPKG